MNRKSSIYRGRDKEADQTRPQLPPTSDSILIEDLALFLPVGVTEAERAQPQPLLISLELRHPLGPAGAADDLTQTIDYFAVCQRLLGLKKKGGWKLIETLAEEIAREILSEFHPLSVTVQVKKFIIPQTRWVAVKITRGNG